MLLTSIHFNQMFLINDQPANDILTPLVLLNCDESPKEVESIVRTMFNEDWFDTKTSSLKGNDNRLNHRIRSIRSQWGIVTK